mgnify:CR=1 FL=1
MLVQLVFIQLKTTNFKRFIATNIPLTDEETTEAELNEVKNPSDFILNGAKKKGKKNSKGDFEKNGIRVWSLKSSQKLKKNNAMERAREKTMTHAPRYYKHELRREIQEVKRRSGL